MSESWTVRLEGESLPDRALIGGKAWSIAWMKSMQLPVPPAFVITTRACCEYLETGEMPSGLEEEVNAQVGWLEQQLGRQFGGSQSPLLLSVRSGAVISMPGMMDTVLNLGINDVTESALAKESGSEQFARDTHRRFLELYGSIVEKVPGIEMDPKAEPAVWHQQLKANGANVPGEVREQLMATVKAVFDSWNARRAKRYRQHNNIPHDLGTAVTVQAMVFGNLDESSGTGVLFSRNPLSGERKPYGEYLPNAQGEDVVSGKFTPLPLSAMEQYAPQALTQLLESAEALEQANRDAQDIEFTVQRGELFLLQARAAKRAPAAAVKIAVEMVQEGLIDTREALSRVTPEQIHTLLLPRLAAGVSDTASPVVQGEGACPGVACGVVVTDSEEAERLAQSGEAVILARRTTSPDDVHGMIAAKGIITELGGSTSHAAVVSRALGRPCVVGVGDGVLGALAGQVVTVEGESGQVYLGALDVVSPSEEADPYLSQLIKWSREHSTVQVHLLSDCEASADVLDLDLALEENDTDSLPELMAGHEVVKGGILSNEIYARMALKAGIKKIYTQPILPSLLCSLENPS